MRSDTIRQSKQSDLRAIHSWLKKEDAEGVRDNFLCNWEVVENFHKDGRLTVYVDGLTGVPVAFQLGGLLHPGILEVRIDMRRKGTGRKLVEHCVAKAREKDENFLIIQCEPPSSIPFWRSMGIKPFGDQIQSKLAYRALGRKHQLPSGGKDTEVATKFYSEERKWTTGDSIPPYEVLRTAAVVMADGVVYLEERAAFCKQIYGEKGDPVIEIIVGGEPRYLDKAKYPEATRIGVRRCTNGFYIDQVYPGRGSPLSRQPGATIL